MVPVHSLYWTVLHMRVLLMRKDYFIKPNLRILYHLRFSIYPQKYFY